MYFFMKCYVVYYNYVSNTTHGSGMSEYITRFNLSYKDLTKIARDIEKTLKFDQVVVTGFQRVRS